MSELSATREALKPVLETASMVRAYAYWPDTFTIPTGGAGAIVVPAEGEFDGLDEGKTTLDVHIAVGLGQKLEAAQRLLDQYLAASGDRSIRAALLADRTLGGTVSQVFVRGFREYNTKEISGLEVFGAIITVEVWIV